MCGYVACEAVAIEDEAGEVGELSDLGGDVACESVIVEVELCEVCEIANLGGDSACNSWVKANRWPKKSK